MSREGSYVSTKTVLYLCLILIPFRCIHYKRGLKVQAKESSSWKMSCSSLSFFLLTLLDKMEMLGGTLLPIQYGQVKNKINLLNKIHSTLNMHAYWPSFVRRMALVLYSLQQPDTHQITDFSRYLAKC